VPSFLIKVTFGRWQTDPPWLPAGDLQAAALFDLRFSNNKLSIWKIDDTNSNLDRVIAALSANNGKMSIENVDYVLLPPGLIQSLGVKIEKSPGGTLDRLANSEWHHDIVELSVSKIVAIAECIRGQTILRKREREIQKLLKDGLEKNHIDITRADKELRPKLEALM
jgi:hypothetical protein